MGVYEKKYISPHNYWITNIILQIQNTLLNVDIGRGPSTWNPISKLSTCSYFKFPNTILFF